MDSSLSVVVGGASGGGRTLRRPAAPAWWLLCLQRDEVEIERRSFAAARFAKNLSEKGAMKILRAFA